ncbi:MAG: hypothetical protein QF536_10485, partial [Arenicellales bacterium]|nr:hypothetical protein [Arenicellales bacterium]
MSLTRNTLHGETPRLQVSLESAGGRHTVELMPDSGATCSITDHSMVLKWGLPMVAVDPAAYHVTTVTGESINIVGKSAITIHMEDKGEYLLHFLVAQDTDIGEIIVGWGDLHNLHLFPLSCTTFLGSASRGEPSSSGSPQALSSSSNTTHIRSENISAIQSSSKAFLEKIKNNPPTRSYTEIPRDHPNYDAEIKKAGAQMVEDLKADYPPAFG